ncbi:MAG: sensor histidine kinase [Gammaproteobacteria bacterium]
MSSLRGKITLAYSSLALIVLILSGIAVFDLLFLERQVHEGVAVSGLNASILEMRRQEKNLFLYADLTALAEADHLAEETLKTLHTEQPVLADVSNRDELDALKRAIHDYRNLLADWHPEQPNKAASEARIRDQGQRISSVVETFVLRERQVLADAVRKSRWWLLISMLIVGLLVFLVGRLLARAVVTPLRRLESRLMPIAEGRFDHLEPGSTDREFVTFADAFNHMLKELINRRRRLLQSEKLASLGILAAGVAHELNNPLSNISSSCQLLLEEFDSVEPAQIEAWLRQIDSETDRARRIVLDLLEYARQRELQVKPVKLADVIDKTKTLLGSALRSNAITLHIDIADNLYVTADPHRLLQVFINLLRNAVDAATDKGLQIKIHARECANSIVPLPEDAEVLGNQEYIQGKGGPFIEIIVEDNGPGIPADVLPHIFDPFYTTREPGKGMGLGLYIIQEIIQEHNGCIAVSAHPSKGTQIILRLPCGGDTE